MFAGGPAGGCPLVPVLAPFLRRPRAWGGPPGGPVRFARLNSNWRTRGAPVRLTHLS